MKKKMKMEKLNMMRKILTDCEKNTSVAHNIPFR